MKSRYERMFGPGSDLPVIPAPPGRLQRASDPYRLEAAFWQPRTLYTVLGLFVLGTMAAMAQSAAAEPGILATLARWAPLIFWGAPGEFGGFLLNLAVSFLAMAIGTVAGLFLGLGQISLLLPVRQSCWLVTQFFRNAPWLVLLFYIMFLLPFGITVFGVEIPFPAWIKATIGLSLPVMANIAEITRGAINSVPTGQWESAESLAFSRSQTLWRIILPQCVKRMLPPWMNWYAILTMATPLISIVGVNDALRLTQDALASINRGELLMPMYLMVLVWFFLYCYPIARFTQYLERRYHVNL